MDMGTYRQKPRWTKAQVQVLLDGWDKLRDEDIANVVGRTLKSVRRKRQELMLKKGHGRGIVAPAKNYTPEVFGKTFNKNKQGE